MAKLSNNAVNNIYNSSKQLVARMHDTSTNRYDGTLADYTRYRQQKEEQERLQAEYQQYLINKAVNPNVDSQYDLASYQAAQQEGYQELPDQLKNDLTELNKVNQVEYDPTGLQNIRQQEVQVSEEDSGLQNILPWNLYKNIKKAYAAKNEAEQNVMDKYGLNSSYDLNTLKDLNKADNQANEIASNKRAAEKQRGLTEGYLDSDEATTKALANQQKWHNSDSSYGVKKPSTARNYLQEIEYANNYLSDNFDDPDTLRNEVTAYLDSSSKASDAQSSFAFNTDLAGNSAVQSQADYYQYDANNKAKAIMEKYGITDSDEFNKLSQYVRELNDYDSRVEQQEAAYANVHTGSKADNIKGGIKNSAIALGANIAGGAGAIAETVNYALGQKGLSRDYADVDSPLNANSKYMAFSNATSDYQGQTQQALSEYNKALGIVYGAGMSALESMETSAPGALGGASRVATNALSLAPFAANAYGTALSEGVTSGKSMGDAITSALISAGIETTTEIASVDKFWDIAKSGSSLARNVVVDFLVSSGIEGTEEGLGDVAELIIDNIRYGDDSDYNQAVKSYIGKVADDGHVITEDEARSLARADWLAQLREDIISGAISGAMGGAGATALGIAGATANANEVFGDFTSEDYKAFADGLDVGKSPKEALDAVRWNTKSENKVNEDGIALYDLENNAEDYSNDDINAAENAEFDEGGHEYTNESAQKSMQNAKAIAQKLSQQDKVSTSDRVKLWYAYNDAITTEAEAQKEKAEQDKKDAEAAEKAQAEYAAHEAKVDAYNAEHGMQTTENTVEQSIREDIPEDLRVEQNDATAGEVHKAMAQSANFDQLTEAYTKGVNSTNENTRVQTVRNLDNLAAMLEKKGVATEEQIQALKKTDAEIYQAGYTGEEISTATTRQKQIYNAGQQAAIKVKAENNLTQRKQMTQNADSIIAAAEKDLYTSGYQTGMNASSYDRILKTASAAARNGIPVDEAMSKVQADMSVVGGDQNLLKATVNNVYNYAQEKAIADVRYEIARAVEDQGSIQRFGKGVYADNRTDKTVPINGTDVLNSMAQVTGLDVVVVDDDTAIGHSQGGFDVEQGVIYLNAGKANRIASTVYHETGEFASVFAPEEFQGFVKAANKLLLDRLGAAKYNEIREDYLQRYSKQAGKTDADLDKEIACDLIYQLIGNKKGMTKLFDAVDANNSPQQAKSIKEKLANWIKNLAQSLKELFSDFDPSSSQRKMADAQLAQMDEIVDMLNQSIAKAANAYQQAKVNGANVVSETTSEMRSSLGKKDIENGKASFEHYGTISGGTMRFSEATYEDGGRKFLEDYLNRAEDLSQEQKDDIIDRLDWAYKIVKDLSRSEFQYYSGWAGTKLTTDPVTGNPLITMNAPGNKPIKSVAVNNGEYPLNIDFSQICKKRMTLNAVINSLVEDYGLNLPTLTESDINTINQTIKEHGYEIACGLCFVDAKRYRVGKWAESFTGEYDTTPKNAKKGWNDIVQMLRPADKNSNAGFSYFNYATDIPKTTTAERTMDQLSEEEIDKSAIEKMLGKFAQRDEDGNIVGISGYVQDSGKRRNPTEQIKMAWEIYSDPSMRKMLSKDDLISSEGLDAIREQNPALYSLVNAHWGAGKPKLPHGATAYGNEILRSSTWGSKNNFDPETAKMVGGVRVQSFSDYEANMFFDYCQLFADMAARKLTSHGYTKETDYVRLFGMTGQKINMSIVAKAANLTDEQKARYNKFRSQANMLKDAEFAKIYETSGFDTDSINAWAEKNGMSGKPIREIANAMADAGVSIKDILLREDETFDIDDALELQRDARYADNCGIIWIAVSDEQMKFMLDSDDVPMVIPYHSSGVSAFIKKERNLLLYKDYQDYQTTKGTNGKALPTGKEFDFYKSLYETNDPKVTADEYLAWCKENGYTPKFNIPGIVDHPNYYKLLIDFKVYDYNGVDPAMVANRRYLPQQEIQMAFPENTNDIVVDSLKRQQATMDKLNADFANQNDGILSELSDKLGLKDGSRMRMSEEEAKNIQAVRANLEDVYINGFKDKRSLVDLGKTPSKLVSLGIRDIPMVGTARHLYSIMATEDKADADGMRDNVNYHETGLDKMVEVIQALNDPVLVYRDKKGNGMDLAVYTNVIGNEDGLPIRVIINPIASGVLNNVFVDVNRLRSAYELREMKDDINDAFKDHRVLYVNKSQSIIDLAESWFSGQVDESDFDSRIAEYRRDVNALANDQTQKGKTSSGIRNSIGEDSNGTPLTPTQREYFKDSKAVDENGRLKVMYHGTFGGGFTVFNTAYAYYGFFFTDNKDIARSYTGSDTAYAPTATSNEDIRGLKERNASVYYETYLNLKNPLEVNADGHNWKSLRRQDTQFRDDMKEIADIIEASTGEDGYDYIVPNIQMSFADAIMDELNSHKDEFSQEDINRIREIADRWNNIAGVDGRFISYDGWDESYSGLDRDEMKDYIKNGYIPMNSNDFAMYAQQNGYDGVIFNDMVDPGPESDWWEMPSTIMVAFNSNQVKSINNENPTEDVDIRRSMNLDDTRNMNEEDISANRDEIADILEQGKELLKGTKVNKQAVQNIVMEEKRKFGSAIDTVEFTDNLTKLFAYLHNGKSINYNDFVAVMQDVARPAIDQAYTTQASREDFAQFRNAIDGMEFSLTMEQRKAISSAFGSMKVFQRYYPEIHINQEAQNISDQWSTLVDISRGLLDENVDASDMPTALVDALEALRPSMNNWEDNTQAAHDMALDIISKYLGNYHDEGANKAVINEFTKNAEKQIKAKQKQWQAKTKADYNERLKAERAYQKELAANRVAKANERSAEQIARLRAKNATRISDIRERQRRSAQLQQINKTASKLYQYLTNPTDQNHIPRDLQEPVMQLMASLDMSQPSIRQGEDGKWHTRILAGRTVDEATGRYVYEWKDIAADTREEAIQQYNEALADGLGSDSARKWYDRMQDMSKLYAKLKDDTANEPSQDMADFLQGLDGELTSEFDRILKDGEVNGKASVADLGSEELKVINKVLKNVLHAVNGINKSYTMPSAQISEIAGEVMDKADRVNGRKNHNRNVDGAINFMMLSNATPETYMHGIGADQVTDIMIAAQNQKAWRIREANEYSDKLFKDHGFTSKEIEQWDKPQQYMNGKITATKAQIMTIYELLQREDARAHLLLGGIKFGAIGNNTNTQNRVIHLTEEQYNDLINEALTEKEKAVADGMQRFLAINCSKWGNETSMKLYGYEKFFDDRYWPMVVDNTSVDTRTSEMMGGIANTIKNMGMTKATVSGANNALVINGAIDVYAKHISDMAVYSSWAAPLQDMIRFFNYKEVSDTDNGFIERRSTKEAIERMFGTGGTDYFKKLVSSIEGTEQSSYEGPNTIIRLTSAAKKAAVLGNVRVMVQQPTAIVRAATMINPTYLITGSAYKLAPYYEEAKELRNRSSAVFWLKNQGNIDGQITQSFKAQVTGVQSWSDTFSEKTGALAGEADAITWAAMYRAVFAEQVDKFGKDKIGTKEFEDAVNSRFDHIMLRTQVYDGTITRSQFMRSTDKLSQLQTAFMAEPVKTYNVILRDVIDFQQSTRGSQERKDAVKALTKDTAVLAMTATANAFMQSLWDGFRNAGDPDEDDEYWARVWDAFIGWDGNLVDNLKPWNWIPVFGDWVETAIAGAQKIVSGKSQWSSSSDLSTSGATHLIDAGAALVKYYGAMTDPEKKDKSTQTAYGVMAQVLRAVSDISGLPLYAIQRDAAAFYNTMARNTIPALSKLCTGEEVELPLLYKSKTSDQKQTKEDVYNLARDGASYSDITAAIDKAAETSNSYDGIRNGIKTALKDDFVSLYQSDRSAAGQMKTRIAQIYVYIANKEGGYKDKSDSEKLEIYKKNIDKWLD